MKSSYLIAIIYGWITILAIILISSMFLSVLIRFTSISEFTLSYLTLIIGLLTLFVGGSVTGLKGKQKGWMLGTLTGIGFTLLVVIIQYTIYQEFFSFQQLIYHLTYILAAIVGSIIGVNLVNTNKNTS